jgi:hypothetical protein
MKFQSIDKKILQALQQEAKTVIQKNYGKLRNAIKPIIIDSIYDCPEMESVRSGKLKYDFGIETDPTLIIAWSVADSMRLSYSYSPSYVFNFQITVQPINDNTLLSLPQSFVKLGDGGEIPWLEWLLKKGSKIIMLDFGVLYKQAGRTGGAIMVENISPFMVDPNYAGTDDDNFISRALSKNINKIQQTAWQTLLI